MDRGVHMLDQLSWIFGEPTVERPLMTASSAESETNSVVRLKFSNARGTLQVSWEYPLHNGLRIWGRFGEVVLDGTDIRTYRRRQGSSWTRVPARTDWPADMARTGGKRFWPGNNFACMELQLVAMLRCITYGEAFGPDRRPPAFRKPSTMPMRLPGRCRACGCPKTNNEQPGRCTGSRRIRMKPIAVIGAAGTSAPASKCRYCGASSDCPDCPILAQPGPSCPVRRPDRHRRRE